MREEGYYWVVSQYIASWQIAWWDGSSWWMIGCQHGRTDNEMKEIGPRALAPDER